MSLVAWFIIGGSGEVQARRQVGYVDIFGPGKPGWPAYIERYVEPAVAKLKAAGQRPRIVLGNPFGTLAGEAMAFDQWWHAAKTPWLRDGFVETWKPWIAANRCEVICYLGTLQGDSSFDIEADNWLYRFWGSLRPALDSGMSVGWDASAVVPQDAPAAHAMQLIRSLGHRGYVEARPQHEYLAGWPVIAIDRAFHRSDPEVFSDAHGLPNGKLGRVMLLIDGRDPLDRHARIKQWSQADVDLAVFPADLDVALSATL